MNWLFGKKPVLPVIDLVEEAVTKGNPKRFTHAQDAFKSETEMARRHQAAMERSFGKTVTALECLKPLDLTTGATVAMDAQMKTAMDNNIQQVKGLISQNQGFLPTHLLEYYSAQGFIGWQICAILAQNWLINKVCKMPGQDAVRHGFERAVNKSVELDPDVFDQLRILDKKYRLKNNLIEHYKFARVFGLRHTLFIVDGIDYEAPFNIDGVKEGSYKGMTQIDPYWLAPMFSLEDASDPYSQNFYNPTWWMINGRKIHRSHFVISRNGNDVADLLKPTYFYGGISTTQMIYERVYAAERTANEAPLLAMTKRLLTLTTDTTKAMNNLDAFRAKLTDWMSFINNFGLKVLGMDEKVEQIDTSLAEFNETIRTQYSLVCAAGEAPESKIMGISPKSCLGSEGGYDEGSYHEFLESIQELEMSPIVERHTQLCQRSHKIAPDVNMDVIWNPTDSPTAKEIAEINKIKADTDVALTTAGSIDGLDGRKRLISDKDSNYHGIEENVEGFTLADEEGDPEGGGNSDGDATAEDAGPLGGYFDPEKGTFMGARLITHQRFLDEKKVAEKIAANDFLVNVTPEFEDDGKMYRMIIDGHHSLVAAVRSDNIPVFTMELPRTEVFNAATRHATDDMNNVLSCGHEGDCGLSFYWEENDHPRNEGGEFSNGGSGSSSSSSLGHNFGTNKNKNVAEAIKHVQSLGYKATSENASGRKVNPLYAAMASQGSVFINPASKFWKDPIGGMKAAYESGHLSSPHPLHTIHHEIGHLKYDAPDNFINNSQRDIIQKEVSKYAAMNPKEFVSEVYAAMQSGKKYSQEIMGMYNIYARERK